MILFLWPCSLAVPVLAGWVYAFVVLCPGTPEGSTGSDSGFKASQKTGNGLKSHPKFHPTDREKPGFEPATPGLQDIGLSPTPRRLLTDRQCPVQKSFTRSIIYIYIFYYFIEGDLPSFQIHNK